MISMLYLMRSTNDKFVIFDVKYKIISMLNMMRSINDEHVVFYVKFK